LNDLSRSREDQWFLENERKLIEAAHLAREKREHERAAHEKAEERKRLKDLHFMKCPKCGHDMKEEVVNDVTLDRCVFCEGLYLDAGELEQVYLRKEEDRRSLLRKLIGF